MLANAGPSGEPMATPSICRYMLLLKLNSTEVVARANEAPGDAVRVRLSYSSNKGEDP